MIGAKRYVIVIMIALVFSLVSCMNDSQNTVTNVTNDCAITNVVLGSLKRVVTTRKNSGKDTTYLTTVYGGLYPMYIDQLNKEIYNADSLPLGTKVKSVVFSTFTADGAVAYRNEAGSDTLYSTTDSVDFTSPRLFTCYSYSGKAKKTYTVRVNVRKTNPDLFVWSKVGTEPEFAAIHGMKAVVKSGILHVFAKQDGRPLLFTTQTDSTTGWTKSDLSGDVPAQIGEVVVFKDRFWGVCGSDIVVSENGMYWTKAEMQGLQSASSVIGSSHSFLFAAGTDGVYKSKDGATWSKETIDSSFDLLPKSDLAFTALSMNFNESFENLFWSGLASDGKLSLWKKTIDNTSENNDVWSYYPVTEEIKYPLPQLKSPVMFSYDEKALYVGCLNDTLSAFYVTTDAGRNWIPAANVYVHPRAVAADEVACAVDSNNYVWLICSGSGEVWRGRLNKLAIVKPHTTVTE